MSQQKERHSCQFCCMVGCEQPVYSNEDGAACEHAQETRSDLVPLHSVYKLASYYAPGQC